MKYKRILSFSTFFVFLVGLGCLPAPEMQASELGPLELYKELKTFELGSEVLRVENLSLKRDRIELTFDGVFHFASPIEGRVYGAVFIGKGRLQVEPWSLFEKENMERLLKSDVVDATFTKAVLRFTDDTYKQLAANGALVAGTEKWEGGNLTTNLEKRLLRQTGLNLSARLAAAVMNGDDPGIFFGQFEGGNRQRFCAFLDHQGRVPGSIFGVNGGEKGLLFQYRKLEHGNDIWTAFYNQQDFKQGHVSYSDTFDLVKIPEYRMEIDLRDPGSWLRMDVEVDLVVMQDQVRLIPMKLNEGLSEYKDERLEKGLRVVTAELTDGAPVEVIQEDWEAGFTLGLPRVLRRNDKVTVKLKLEGKDSLWTWKSSFHYPRSTTTWYPRHGYLTRSRFDMTFRHKEKDHVVSVGQRVEERAAGEGEKDLVTRWVMKQPVALMTFAVGRFERHTENIELAGKKVPIEFYSMPSEIQAVKEDFVLAELDNGLRYFSSLYGDYPYGRLGAVYFPKRFGQGFPSLLLLPVRGSEHIDRLRRKEPYARLHLFAFIAHEGAHQWWGNIVGWKSYRDQWLSEGFAEYSGVLYAGFRKKPKQALELVKEMRWSLLQLPGTQRQSTKEKLYEVGPLVLGHRLSSRRSRGAYTTLIYNKGALVLRMLHYLLTDPSTNNSDRFFVMMKDFVRQHRNGWATTESFMQIASQHFATSPIGRKYGLKDLNWFLYEWVHQTGLPSYRLEYRSEPQKSGGVILTGTLYQTGVPEDWFMVLPIVMEFPGNKIARTTVHAFGPATPFKLALAQAPKRVKLDPDSWILSEKTSEKRVK